MIIVIASRVAAATRADVRAARLRALATTTSIDGRTRGRDLYRDNPARARMRAMLIDAAALGARVRLGFIKLDGTLRYMSVLPVPGGDGTYRYITVRDLDQSTDDAPVYRRVSLDTIATCSIELHAGR